jgi:translation initiation factor IF-3
VITKEEALSKARERGEDLILITEDANPPVAKILDFKKFMYEQNKKAQQVKSGSKKSELKEFKFGPTIDDGDLKIRIERSRGFIKEGNRVKITVQMKGRENAYPKLAEEKIQTVVKEMADVAKPEGTPERRGTQISVTLVRL